MLYEKPVRELLRDAVTAMPETFSEQDIEDWFGLNYPRVNHKTVYMHFHAGVVNNSRKYQSRVGEVIYKRSDGSFERYDQQKHGASSKPPRPRRVREVQPPDAITQDQQVPEVGSEIADSLAEIFGSSFQPEILQLRGGGKHEFDLVSEDEGMVGTYVPIGRIRDSRDRFARLAESAWLLQGLTQTASRFVLISEERGVTRLWLEQYAELALGVEFFLLDGEHVVDLKEGLT